MLILGIFANWLAASPIVILGAPLGVFVVHYIGRKPTLILVAFLCVGQFAWTCFVERAALGPGGLILSLLAVALFLAGFEKLRQRGGDLVFENRARKAALDEAG